MPGKQSQEQDVPRSHGTIKNDSRGYAYLPKNLRQELMIQGTGEIPFYRSSGCILLVRDDMPLDTVRNSIELLQKELELRTEESTHG